MNVNQGGLPHFNTQNILCTHIYWPKIHYSAFLTTRFWVQGHFQFVLVVVDGSTRELPVCYFVGMNEE